MQLDAALALGITFEGTTYTTLAQICLAFDAGTLSLADVEDILEIALPGAANGPQMQQ